MLIMFETLKNSCVYFAMNVLTKCQKETRGLLYNKYLEFKIFRIYNIYNLDPSLILVQITILLLN